MVTTNQVESFQFLNLPLFADIVPQRGPLVGMYTSLRAAKRPFVAVIGCDMPFFSPRLLAFQAELLSDTGADAVVPRSRDGLEPLHGVYRRETCLNGIQTAFEMNILSLIGWFKLQQIVEITENQFRPFDPNSRAFINLNTPEENQQAEALAFADQENNRSIGL